MPGRRRSKYDPAPLQDLLQRMLNETKESYRAASSAAGLSPTTISNYMRGVRPLRDACIALADHFGVNPNEVLEAAGYAPMRFFDRRPVDLSSVSPEGQQILRKFEQVADSRARATVYKTVDTILTAYLHAQRDEA